MNGNGESEYCVILVACAFGFPSERVTAMK